MGVIVPHGVLFRGSTEGAIRRKLVEENLLDAVVGLPVNLFYGTGIPAAILIFKKHKPDKTVVFIDASRDYEDNKNQNRLSAEHIEKIASRTKPGRAWRGIATSPSLMTSWRTTLTSTFLGMWTRLKRKTRSTFGQCRRRSKRSMQS